MTRLAQEPLKPSDYPARIGSHLTRIEGDTTVVVHPGGSVHLTGTLQDAAGDPVPGVALKLSSEATVEGMVVDARGGPVQGARIAADHAPTWAGVTP